MKRVASSAYIEMLQVLQFGCSLPSKFRAWDFLKSRLRGSIANKNNIGEMGSHCLTPLQCRIFFPGCPLRRTEDEAVHHKEEIQSLDF
jgi:hypothetical protein